MITIIKTLNINRQTTAILENAYGIGYELTENKLWTAHFSLPLNDPKVDKVELLRYVEIKDDDRYIGLFRILPKKTVRNESTQEVSFECEHVLGTLINKYLIGYHQLTNYTTRECIQYLLDQQHVKHIKLGRVAFTRYFHYSWENENLLSALFSIPKPLDEQYRWVLDTSSYPWTLHLDGVEDTPTARIKEKHNLASLEIVEDPTPVFNRIIPFGSGEGVNKLTIKDVNNGVPYLDKRNRDDEIIEYIWVDDRFKDAQALKDSAQALLNDQYKAKASWETTAADVSKITGAKVDELHIGKVVRIDVEDMPIIDMRILKEKRSDITGDPGKATLEMGTLRQDLGTTQADMQRRQRINELYSMGATNINSYTFNDNADPNFPATIEFPFPEDMINVNMSTLRIKTSPYRVPMKGMEAGGHYQKESVVQSKSTEDGGAFVQESVVQSKSTEGGGAFRKESEIKSVSAPAGGNHYHKLFQYGGGGSVQHPEKTFYAFQKEQDYASQINIQTVADGNIYTYEADGDHTHDFSLTIPGINIAPHTHGFSVTIPAIRIPSHFHRFEVTIPAIDIPAHVHKQIYGIHEVNSNVSELTVKIDGKTIPFNGTEGEVDVTEYLRKDSNGKVTRDYHKIEVAPNDFARIDLILENRFFIQSQIGGTF